METGQCRQTTKINVEVMAKAGAGAALGTVLGDETPAKGFRRLG